MKANCVFNLLYHTIRRSNDLNSCENTSRHSWEVDGVLITHFPSVSFPLSVCCDTAEFGV